MDLLCSNGRALLTKMFAMPIYIKTLKYSLFGTKKALRLSPVYCFGIVKAIKFVQMMISD